MERKSDGAKSDGATERRSNRATDGQNDGAKSDGANKRQSE